MPVVFSGLMCHAPIVIPAVAGQDAARCRSTTRAMREVAARLVAAGPERLVLLSPHSPRHEKRWSAWRGRHRGDLGRFRHPELAVDLPDAPEVADSLTLPETRGAELDHGAVVPLAFLWEAGWRGPTAILALPWPEQGAEELGRSLAELSGRTAVLASGDMSHRLKPGAPSGYHPKARDFDLDFVDALRRGDWERAARPRWREEAAEDVVTSTRVATAAAAEPLNDEVLSYEGPWGVGYTEAVFFDPEPPLWAVAIAAVRAATEGRRFHPPRGGPVSQGVFVTLRREGELRGCIGHIEPTREFLYQEVAEVARLSATRDPRMLPVRNQELPELDLEVSLLTPPRPVSDPEALDPVVDGLVVSSGRKRGLLLPEIDGVDSVEQQLAICRRKAGIGPSAPVELSHFQVEKMCRP